MQEQKEFSTVMFGFEKKAVLEYIYEQDKQARAALAELASRNATLEDEGNALEEKLRELSSCYDALKESTDEEREYMKTQASECDKLRLRLNKMSTQYHEKENSLQLQMEINKKMQMKITEQQETIEALQKELRNAEGRFRLFQNQGEDYSELREKLDEFKNEFNERIIRFETEFAELEMATTPEPSPQEQPQAPKASIAEAVKAIKVTPRIRQEEPRMKHHGDAVTTQGSASGPLNKNRFKTIFDEWK